MSRRVGRPAVRIAMALGLGTAALAVWWRLLGGPEVIAALARCDGPLTFLGFLLLASSQLFRLLRWHVFLRAVGAVPIGVTFRTLYASELLNAVLPVKLGDAGRAVAIARIAPFTLGSATATIVLDRFSGIFVRLAVAPLAALLPLSANRSLVASAAVFGLLIAAAAGAGLAFHRRPELFSALTRRGLLFLPERWRAAIEETLASFATSFVSLSLDRTTAIRALVLSLCAFACQAAAFWLWFRAAGAGLGALTALVGTAFLDLLAVVPAPPAGIGVVEWSVTFVYAWALGAPGLATSVTALVSHALWILLVACLGMASAGAIAEMWPRRTDSDAR